jgi:hypothetical protein
MLKWKDFFFKLVTRFIFGQDCPRASGWHIFTCFKDLVVKTDPHQADKTKTKQKFNVSRHFLQLLCFVFVFILSRKASVNIKRLQHFVNSVSTVHHLVQFHHYVNRPRSSSISNLFRLLNAGLAQKHLHFLFTLDEYAKRTMHQRLT